MKIEKEIIQIKNGFNESSLQLTELQKQYFGVLKNNQSIESTVQFFLKQGWLVRFNEFYELIKKLCEQKAILNVNVQNYIAEIQPQNEESFLKILNPFFSPKAKKGLTIEAYDLPFFRSLDPALAQTLIVNSKTIKIPRGIFVCRKNQFGRDLFVVIKGRLGVYKKDQNEQVQMIASLHEGSVLGESGFFLNEPRTADVVSLQDSEILVIPFLPKLFDEDYFNSQKAAALRLRFWVQHALQKSTFFKDIPPDCLDAVVFSGHQIELEANHKLFEQGQSGHSAFILVQGQLSVYQNRKLINTLTQGSILGEISLISSQGIRTAGVIATQNSLLLEITKDEFYRLLSSNLYLAKEVEKLVDIRLTNDSKRKVA